MSQAHQLIIDCGWQGDNSCQLRDNAAKSINIRAQQAFSQYHYYLLFYNHLKNNCQLSVQAQKSQESDLQDYSNIFIKIFYQNQLLFDANFAEFLSRKVELLNLLSQSSKLYRVEFYIKELKKDFQLNFDLNFLLNCRDQAVIQEPENEVLGAKTQFREITSVQSNVDPAESVRDQRFFLFSVLLVFLLLLFLIFVFYRRTVKKKKKHKLAQRKENL